METGIAQEIAKLREQIAAVEAEIARAQSSVCARHESGDAAHKEETELRELTEARDLMASRLDRLESCMRTPQA